MLRCQRAVQDHEGIAALFQLVLRHTDIHGDGVHCAGLQVHKGGVVIRYLHQLFKALGQGDVLLVAAVLVLGQGRQRGRIRLDRHDLAGQVRIGSDAAVLAYHNHLDVIHIGGAPGVFVLTAIDGKAVPDAVDQLGLQLHILGIPVDGLLDQLPAVAGAHFGGQIQVKAYILAVFILVAVGREFRVKAHGKGLGLCLLPVIGGGSIVAAAGQQGQQHQGCRRDCNYFFHGLFLLFLFSVGVCRYYTL